MLHSIDWIILIGTLALIILYGLYKSRNQRNMDSFIKGGNDAKWWTIGLSVMATQASAITFLSTPGQGYSDGLRFVQFYFGLPLAMIVLCVAFLPIYYRLKVYTAYEYLENRFDVKTRTLTSILFLIQRGLAAGITIYAPAIILSTILGWNLTYTNIIIGSLVVLYTVSGGTKAVSMTHKAQMLVIMIGMGAAFYVLLDLLPDNMSFKQALSVADMSGRLKSIDWSIDLNNRYTIWSGLTGGFFLALSYFGTDQSQVGRYLNGRSLRESQMGLIFNAIFKIPMQYFILLIGVMVFVFYQFHKAPLFFNASEMAPIETGVYASEYQDLETSYQQVFEQKREKQNAYVAAPSENLKNEILALQTQENDIRQSTKDLLLKANPDAETNDRDYVFISFILNYLPKGLIGLLLAVIFSAAMSSTASELNALSTTSVMDIYKRSIYSSGDDHHYVKASKWATVLWGVIAILFATYGTLFENLIQYVNIVGSIFYGVILGIFLVGFYIKSIGARAIFIGAILAQLLVFGVFKMTDIGYLWYNVIGCAAVILFSLIIQQFTKNRAVN